MFGAGGRRFKILTVAGIPIYVGTSLLVLAVIFVIADQQNFELMGISSPAAWAVLEVFLFYGAVLAHEAAHAVAARRLGLPVWGITLIGFGGYTQTKSDARGPGGQFLISASGPGTTLVAGIAMLSASTVVTGAANAVLSDLGILQLYFALLNALPALPVDGAKMLMAIVWRVTGDRQKAERVLGPSSIGVGSLLIAAGVVNLSTGGGWGVVLALFGMLMIANGRAVPQRLAIRSLLARGRVAEAMRLPSASVDLTQPVSQALAGPMSTPGGHVVPVTDGGKVVGTLSQEAARAAMATDPYRRIRHAFVPLRSLATLSPDEPLDQALDWVSEGDGLVMDRSGSVVGILSKDDIQRWANARKSAATSGVPPRPDL